MPDIVSLLAALTAESESLDDMVAGGDDAGGDDAGGDDAGGDDAGVWRRPTPSVGWTVADQVGHLAWTDDVALLAATDAPAFAALISRASTASESLVDDAAAERARTPKDELLASWRAGRQALVDALADVPAGRKLPWFGPPMSAASMATARLMETWAHGQDVADALGVSRAATDRLEHVAHIGVRTRDFAYLLNGLTPPADAFRIELVAPSGALWAWGPDDAPQQVAGPALDFCLLVTQRRHRADLSLVASGREANGWLDIAQAFAGPPGGGRHAGQFA